VTTLSYLLLLISAGLVVALLLARRRILALGGFSKPPGIQSPALDSAGALTRMARFETAAALAPVGIVIMDEFGEKVFENAVAAECTAPTADDAVLGLRLRSLFAEAADFDESIEQEIELYSPSPRTMLLQAIPVFEGSKRTGTVAFIEDLTTTSRLDSIRSDFIANASHELKTPLGAMRLLADALLATDRPEVSRDLAERIQGEAGRMTRLVEDILDLALIEQARPQAEAVDICDVARDAVEQSKVLAETTGVAVQLSCAPAILNADRRQLVSAIANLVENAINYTAAKGIDQPAPVEVTVQREGDLAVIEVEDHGIGIPDRHQDRVFERFYRVDRGRSRASGGTGLGLAIVRHVVQNHEGEISLRSVSGVGSTFRIELPALEE
jgi:two-component system sensor histidine kinase SenX3